MSEIATLAGGCFWCLEAAFLQLSGVESAVSGYLGGHVDHPTYEQVCGGAAAAVAAPTSSRPETMAAPRASRSPLVLPTHAPTTRHRQGNDRGSQYRSAIFWHTPEQELAAKSVISSLAAAGVHADPIVTEVVRAETFWPAEDYHRDYFANHPRQPYCQFVVAPKVDKVRAKFANRLK